MLGTAFIEATRLVGEDLTERTVTWRTKDAFYGARIPVPGLGPSSTAAKNIFALRVTAMPDTGGEDIFALLVTAMHEDETGDEKVRHLFKDVIA